MRILRPHYLILVAAALAGCNADDQDASEAKATMEKKQVVLKVPGMT